MVRTDVFRVILLFTFFVFFSCNQKIEKRLESDYDDTKVSIFLSLPPKQSGDAAVWINDSLLFEGNFIYGKNSRIYNDMLVGKIKKDSVLCKFKIKLLERDTIFHYNMKNVDSIVVTLDGNRFYISNDNDVGVWIID